MVIVAALVLFLFIVATVAVVAVLILGIFAMSRGGAFEARWGNRLMRLRVLTQGVAVALLGAAGAGHLRRWLKGPRWSS